MLGPCITLANEDLAMVQLQQRVPLPQVVAAVPGISPNLSWFLASAPTAAQRVGVDVHISGVGAAIRLKLAVGTMISRNAAQWMNWGTPGAGLKPLLLNKPLVLIFQAYTGATPEPFPSYFDMFLFYEGRMRWRAV